MPRPTVPTPTHSLEAISDVLDDRRRRFVPYHLGSAPNGVSQFDAVETWIRDLEPVGAPAFPPGHDGGEIATALHPLHPPRLAERDVNDYDWRTKTIRCRPDDLLEAHLNPARRRDFER